MAQEGQPLAIPTPDFSRVQRNEIGNVLLDHADRLRLSEKTLVQVREVVTKRWSNMAKSRAELWKRRIVTVEKLESGEWLPWSDSYLLVAELAHESGRVDSSPLPLEGVEFDLLFHSELKRHISKATLDQAVAIAQRIDEETSAKLGEELLRPGIEDELRFNDLQRRQYATLRARLDALSGGKKATARRFLRGIVYRLLEPRQQLVIEAKLWPIATEKP